MRTRHWAKRAAIVAGVVGAGALLARSSRRRTEVDAAYRPLDVPKPVADGVWIVDAAPISAMGLTLPVRMTVLRLADGGLLLHSPVRFTPALRDALAALGPIRHLVAPSPGHWTFVKDWQGAVTDAVTWAVPGLRDRAQIRAAGLRIDRELEEHAPAAWADTVEQGLVPGGMGLTEAFFFHRPSRTLVLTDLVQNLEAEKLPPVTGAVMTAAGATNGRAAAYLRPVIRMGGAPARAAAARMVALAPERVVFAHGDWFDRDGTARLRRSLDWLLPADA